MIRYLKLVGVQLRTSIAKAAAYRADFIIQGVMSLAVPLEVHVGSGPNWRDAH